MLSAYPFVRAHDEAGYVAGLVQAVLAYPLSIAQRCADPVHGAPRDYERPPVPSQLIAWFERETNRLETEKRRADRLNDVHKLRSEARRLEDARKQRPTIAELKAKYGENWGLTTAQPKPQRRISNSCLFERAAANGGCDAGSGIAISPHLLATIRGPQSAREEQPAPRNESCHDELLRKLMEGVE